MEAFTEPLKLVVFVALDGPDFNKEFNRGWRYVYAGNDSPPNQQGHKCVGAGDCEFLNVGFNASNNADVFLLVTGCLAISHAIGACHEQPSYQLSSLVGGWIGVDSDVGLVRISRISIHQRRFLQPLIARGSQIASRIISKFVNAILHTCPGDYPCTPANILREASIRFGIIECVHPRDGILQH